MHPGKEGSVLVWKTSFDELETDTTYLRFEKLEKELQNVISITKLTRDLERIMGLWVNDPYTNAGMLLADENDYKYGVDMVRFGKTDSIFIERNEIKGQSILAQYEQAMQMFDKWYGPYEEVVGFYRETRIHIPREAYRWKRCDFKASIKKTV